MQISWFLCMFSAVEHTWDSKRGMTCSLSPVIQMAEGSVGLFVYIKHKPIDTIHFSTYNYW